MKNLPRPIVWAGMTLMLATGFIHMIAMQYAFQDATYKGLLFIVGSIAALIAATGIQEGARIWGWSLAALVASCTFIGYLANCTVGLPGLPVDPQAWQHPLPLIAFVAEGGMLVLVLVAFFTNRHPRQRLIHRIA